MLPWAIIAVLLMTEPVQVTPQSVETKALPAAMVADLETP